MTIKPFMLLATTAILLAAPSLGYAKNSKAPGQMMHDNGSVKGEPGASGYAPGHLKKKKGSVQGYPGASGYAPGRTTTGSSVRTDFGGTTYYRY